MSDKSRKDFTYKRKITHFFSPCLLALATIDDTVSKISDGDLMKVVKCMEHAVSAVRPRVRYSAGWDAKIFWLPLSYMPSCVSDFVLRSKMPSLAIET